MAVSNGLYAPVLTNEDPERAVQIQPLSVETIESYHRDDPFPPNSTASRLRSKRILEKMLWSNCLFVDFRFVVVMANLVMIGIKIDAMWFVAIDHGSVKIALENFAFARLKDDERLRNEVFESEKWGSIEAIASVLEVIDAIDMGLYACGIYGATAFKAWGIVVAGCTCGATLVCKAVVWLNPRQLATQTGLMIVLFLYPHWRTYKLLREGTWNNENYRQGCCCCWRSRLNAPPRSTSRTMRFSEERHQMMQK